MPRWYLCLFGDERPKGAFDLEFWAEDNDPTCDPRSGGLANMTSMAAAGGVSQFTLVNSVLLPIIHCLHWEGPVVISTINTIVPACRDYLAE